MTALLMISTGCLLAAILVDRLLGSFSPSTDGILDWRNGMNAKNQKDKKKALELAIAGVEKQFGKGAIWNLDGKPPMTSGRVHTTGCLSLDGALGIGGLPAGRVVEIYGPESSGKTTLMLEVIAGVQRAGGVAVFVDAEHALDLQYAERLGVDPQALLIAQPDHGEEALEITDVLVRSGAVDLVVIDSVAALVPKAEIEGDMGDHHVGLQARLMSQALRKLTGSAGRTGTTVVFINQLRQKIGVTFGSPEVTTGGNALKYYASVRIDIRRIGAIKKADDPVGNRTRVKIVKNKMAPPFRLAEFDILYGRGINAVGDLLDLCVSHGLITKSGAWYAHEDTRMGQGRDRATVWLEENPTVRTRLRDQVRSLLGLSEAPDASPLTDPNARAA